MKLSKLYSNQDNLFEPIIFNDGLNIILGEMRLPDNPNKDSHCLGKSILGLLIDYCLLKGRSSSFFLFKHFDSKLPNRKPAKLSIDSLKGSI